MTRDANERLNLADVHGFITFHLCRLSDFYHLLQLEIIPASDKNDLRIILSINQFDEVGI